MAPADGTWGKGGRATAFNNLHRNIAFHLTAKIPF
jgi:hypothetical protein